MRLLYQDLYLRIGSRYIKVMRSGDEFNEIDAKKFLDKKVEFLYLEKGSVQNFIETYRKKLLPLRSNKQLTPAVKFELTSSNHEIVSEVAQTFGYGLWTNSICSDQTIWPVLFS